MFSKRIFFVVVNCLFSPPLPAFWKFSLTLAFHKASQNDEFATGCYMHLSTTVLHSLLKQPLFFQLVNNINTSLIPCDFPPTSPPQDLILKDEEFGFFSNFVIYILPPTKVPCMINKNKAVRKPLVSAKTFALPLLTCLAANI